MYRLYSRLIVFVVAGIIPMSESALADATRSHKSPLDRNRPDVAYFSGQITTEAVEAFISKYAGKSTKTLVVSSAGGDALAGMQFGDWIRSNNVDVEVLTLCVSACANYVFPAGRNKKIHDGALVLWHGSIEQQDLRQLHEKYQMLLLKNYETPSSISAEDRDFLALNLKRFQSLVANREKQARFFDRLQTNEYITRAGQEPTSLGVEYWVATLRAMALFGINDVEAPMDYGSAGYLSRLGPKVFIYCQGSCAVIDVDSSGRARPSKHVNESLGIPKADKK